MLGRREGKKKRWLALLLAGAMVLSGMGTPSAVVRAEEGTAVVESAASTSGNDAVDGADGQNSAKQTPGQSTEENEQNSGESVQDATNGEKSGAAEAQSAAVTEANTDTKKDTSGSADQYVLDAADLTTFAAGAKKDGEEQKAGTDDYFTILWSAKSKVESNSKTFEDGTTLTQRINFGGKLTQTKNAVSFKTTGAAEVKVWWVEGGDDNRQMALFAGSGAVADKTDVELTKNALCISTLKVTDAGTYYLGGLENNNYIFKVIVTPQKAAEPKTFTFESSALDAVAAGTKADGDEQKAGTDDYFTLIYSSKSKVDSSSKTFEDGYKSGQRVNFGGAATTGKNALKFTTSGAAEVKVWWVEGGDDNRQMALLAGSGEVVTQTDVTLTKNAIAISTLKVTDAGTYYLGGLRNNNYIYKVVVTETAGTSPKPARADWAKVEAPEIISAIQEKGQVNVTVKANISYDGADKIEVTMIDADGKEIGSTKSSKEGSEVTVSFAPTASGTYSFTVKAIREGEEDKVGNSVKADFKLPLTAPKLSSVTNVGKGSVQAAWDAVKEAERYVVTVEGTDIRMETEDTEAIVENLTVGKTYTISVVAIRGEDISGKGTMEVKVVDNVQRVWSVSTYGSSTDSKNNGVKGNINDGAVTVFSENGKGKIVPGSTDGLTYYYTKIRSRDRELYPDCNGEGGQMDPFQWTGRFRHDGIGYRRTER